MRRVTNVKPSPLSINYQPDHGNSTLGQTNTNNNDGVLSLNINKAGLDGLPLEKINKIIHDASSGSKFHLQKQKAQVELNQKIDVMKKEYKKLTHQRISGAQKRVDKFLRDLRSQSQSAMDEIIVHLDMDAYFAAVEILKNPSLRDKPVAVGSLSMLSTANYVARTKGVRSGMPGFIAIKLCPELIIMPLDMDKYFAMSEEIQGIVREFDYNAVMCMDEVKLNITETLKRRYFAGPEALVAELRANIYRRTGLTASAGIAPNGLLAKICSNINKPNGQYYLTNSEDKINDFLKILPVGKVTGIGKVTEQMLNGLEIFTCGEMYEKRAIIDILFTPCIAKFLIASSIGIGNSRFDENELESDRKSVGVERTFTGTSNIDKINKICLHLCENLNDTLDEKNLQGNTFHIKIKTTDYEIKTKTEKMKIYINDTKQMYSIASGLLKSFQREVHPIFEIRLLGIRMTGLRYNPNSEMKFQCVEEPFKRTKQPTISEIAHDLAKLREKMPQCPICLKRFDCSYEAQRHANSCIDMSSTPTTSNIITNNEIVNGNGFKSSSSASVTTTTFKESHDLFTIPILPNTINNMDMNLNSTVSSSSVNSSKPIPSISSENQTLSTTTSTLNINTLKNVPEQIPTTNFNGNDLIDSNTTTIKNLIKMDNKDSNIDIISNNNIIEDDNKSLLTRDMNKFVSNTISFHNNKSTEKMNHKLENYFFGNKNVSKKVDVVDKYLDDNNILKHIKIQNEHGQGLTEKIDKYCENLTTWNKNPNLSFDYIKSPLVMNTTPRAGNIPSNKQTGTGGINSPQVIGLSGGYTSPGVSTTHTPTNRRIETTTSNSTSTTPTNCRIETPTTSNTTTPMNHRIETPTTNNTTTPANRRNETPTSNATTPTNRTSEINNHTNTIHTYTRPPMELVIQKYVANLKRLSESPASSRTSKRSSLTPIRRQKIFTKKLFEGNKTQNNNNTSTSIHSETIIPTRKPTTTTTSPTRSMKRKLDESSSSSSSSLTVTTTPSKKICGVNNNIKTIDTYFQKQ